MLDNNNQILGHSYPMNLVQGSFSASIQPKRSSKLGSVVSAGALFSIIGVIALSIFPHLISGISSSGLQKRAESLQHFAWTKQGSQIKQKLNALCLDKIESYCKPEDLTVCFKPDLRKDWRQVGHLTIDYQDGDALNCDARLVSENCRNLIYSPRGGERDPKRFIHNYESILVKVPISHFTQEEIDALGMHQKTHLEIDQKTRNKKFIELLFKTHVFCENRAGVDYNP